MSEQSKELKHILVPTYNMNMQDGHDAKAHTLNPTENGIRQAKLTEVHPSNIS